MNKRQKTIAKRVIRGAVEEFALQNKTYVVGYATRATIVATTVTTVDNMLSLVPGMGRSERGVFVSYVDRMLSRILGV